jgi:hypothetical protein
MIDKTPNRPAERTTRRQLEVVTIPIQASIDQVARWAALEYTRDMAGRPKFEPHVVVSGQVDADEVAHIAELAVADDEVAVLFAVYSQLCCTQLLVKETRKRGLFPNLHIARATAEIMTRRWFSVSQRPSAIQEKYEFSISPLFQLRTRCVFTTFQRPLKSQNFRAESQSLSMPSCMWL